MKFLTFFEFSSLYELNMKYYDEILDLYNKVGMNGLSDDEREYLVSGGSSKIPKRFKQNIKTDKEFFKNSVKSSKIIQRLKEILDKNSYKTSYPFDGERYLDMMFEISFPYNKYLYKELKDLQDELLNDDIIKWDNEFIKFLRLEGKQIKITVPKDWEDELFEQ